MATDWLASSQITTGDGTGGWYYGKGVGADGDQSATGWVTMGLGYAAHSMGITLPADMLTRLSTWNDFIQCDTPGPDVRRRRVHEQLPGLVQHLQERPSPLRAGPLRRHHSPRQRVQDGLTFMTASLAGPHQRLRFFGRLRLARQPTDDPSVVHRHRGGHEGLHRRWTSRRSTASTGTATVTDVIVANQCGGRTLAGRRARRERPPQHLLGAADPAEGDVARAAAGHDPGGHGGRRQRGHPERRSHKHGILRRGQRSRSSTGPRRGRTPPRRHRWPRLLRALSAPTSAGLTRGRHLLLPRQGGGRRDRLRRRSSASRPRSPRPRSSRTRRPRSSRGARRTGCATQ